MGNFLVGMINTLIKGLGSVLSIIFAILPPSPFHVIDNSPIAQFLPTINYFVPVSEIMLIGEAWLLSIGVFYVYQIVLRWVKAIE